MGGQKNFQKLHEMARKLNENFFGPPLHPKNRHFLSKILNFGGRFRHLLGVFRKKERWIIHKVVINYPKMQKKIFLHFLIVYDYLMNYPSFFFSNDHPKVPKMTAKVQNFAQKMSILRVKGGSKKFFDQFSRHFM